MCGIIYTKRFDEKCAKNSISKRYEKQKERGKEGFGFVEIVNGFVEESFRSEVESDIKILLKGSKSDEILFHHRFPTSTPNFIESTHPILVSNDKLKYNYYVVHNGIITNDEILKEKHNKLGFKYLTEITKRFITSGNVYEESIFNDSESFAIDLSMAIEKNRIIESSGSIAFICIQFDKKTSKAVALYYGRNNGNPLKIELNNTMFCLSSESGENIKSNVLFRYDYESKITTSEDKTIGYYTEYVKTTYATDYDDESIRENDFNWSNPSSKHISDEYYQNLEDLHFEVEQLQKELKKANDSGDWNYVVELDESIFDLQQEIKDMTKNWYE